MFTYIPTNILQNADLNVYQCGTQECSPGHSFGPAVRDHFLIHYILSGKGVFHVGNTTCHLKEGDGFLICPDVITYYQADTHDPWSYSWVGFHGLKAEAYLKDGNLTLDNPIFTYDSDGFIKECFEHMMETKKIPRGRDVRLLSYLYLFLSKLIEANGNNLFTDGGMDKKEQYAKKVIEYIEMNYSRKMSIAEAAHYIGLDRCYLGSIFKHYFNVSMQEFLINYRVNKACELMKTNNLTIGDISRSIGYDDPLLFSKIFRKVKGVSPKDYKKNQQVIHRN